MSSLNLNLSTVELTSTLLTAPLNGAPSSADYNDCQRANLVDLSTIVSFINNQMLPLVNTLPATALQPSLSPTGIQGSTIWSNTSDLSTLFFDSLSSSPLTIYESLILLNGIIETNNQQLIDLGIEVATLQSILGSTNQNDVSLALQNLTSTLNQVVIIENSQGIAISALQSQIGSGGGGGISASGPLTSHALILGDGGTEITLLGTLGTTSTVLHGNASGAPTFGSVVETDISLSNVTTNNVSTSAHGFVPIAPGTATLYLDGTGHYSTPAGGGGGGGASFSQTIGDGSTLIYTVNHNLGTSDIVVEVHNISTGDMQVVDVDIISINAITVTFGSAPALNSERVVVLGATVEGGSISLTDNTGLFTVVGSPATLGTGFTLSAFASQSQGSFLAGPASGTGPAEFRVIQSSDLPTIPLNEIVNATGNTSIIVGGYFFNTSYTTGLTGATGISPTYNSQVGITTLATSVLNQKSPAMGVYGNVWNGTVSIVDEWSYQVVYGTGANPSSTFTFLHAGSTGFDSVQVPALNLLGSLIDSTATAGVSGYILSTTGTGTKWIPAFESVQSVSANATLGFAGGRNTLVEATAGAPGITLTLPTAVGINGQIIRVVMVDTGVGGVTIITTASQTISGLNIYELTNTYQSISMESDGSNWIVISTADVG